MEYPGGIQMDEMNKPLLSEGSTPSHRKPRFRINYEVVFWVFFLAITLWAILDRFFVNLFPMAIKFPPLTGPPGTAPRPAPPASVALFDGLGRASGRLFLVVINALFLTQCKTTENLIMAHCPRWLDLGDMRTVHNRIHYILGAFFMAMPMLVHVWITFLPALAGVGITTARARPANKITPFVTFDPATGIYEMFVSHDDIFRVVLMTVLFGVLFPLSMSNWGRRKSFTVTQWLHIGCAFVFTIDMIRKSPHAQVFSPWVVAFYIGDRILGYFVITGQARVIHREVLDDGYMVLFLYVPDQARTRPVGSGYYLQFSHWANRLDISHPYMSFQNHGNENILEEWRDHDVSSDKHKYVVEQGGAGGKKKIGRRATLTLDKDDVADALNRQSVVTEENDDVVFFSNWNTAVVVQIHRTPGSFSERLAESKVGTSMTFWGPYISEYGDLTIKPSEVLPPLVLIGTGSGAAFLLDFYLYISHHQITLRNPVTIYYSTNSVPLLQFVTDLLQKKPMENLTVNAHLTSASEFDEEDSKASVRGTDRNLEFGRLSFTEVMREASKLSDTEVYFCGSAALQWKVQVACAKYGLTYHPGHRFSSDGRISAHHVGKGKCVCRFTQFPLCLTY